MKDKVVQEDEPQDGLKRPNSPSETPTEPPSKKVRLKFSAKEFRKQLSGAQKTQVLQWFLQSIGQESKQDCVLSYLEAGGSVTEILQMMELDPLLAPSLAFEVINHILLQVNAKLPKYQRGAQESCHHLLNRHITDINRMLSLGSSTHERLVCLKLLTTIATFSLVLAKNILVQVNFNPSNLEMLTKVHEGKRKVREAFIHFISAFLIGGHFPALCALLEKKGMMTNVVRGLKFDAAPTVILFITAMKTSILENPQVSKSVKMKFFHTGVIRDVITLYNWKGPDGEESSKKLISNTVDEIDKSKVSECVHALLLVLCTSHKFGVIFKDPTLGLDKHHNKLMNTVLDSLERPWEHSYASDLVIKICKVCPDLIRTMWLITKPHLQPRWTVKWLKAVEFVVRLLNELGPECIEPSIPNLNVDQVCQIVKPILMPLPVLTHLIPENRIYERPAIKHQVLKVLLKMTESALGYLNSARNWPNINYEVLQRSLSYRVKQNFLSVEAILDGWDQPDEDSPIAQRLELAFELLNKYRVLSPDILKRANLNLDVRDFLHKIETVATSPNLQIKAVDFFLDLEPALFREHFDGVLCLILKKHYESPDSSGLKVLNRLMQNTHVFDQCPSEIDLWIDGVLNLKSYDESVAVFLCDLLRTAPKFNGDANFSPMILGIDASRVNKSVKSYLNFVVLGLCHLQSDLSGLKQLVSNADFLQPELGDYVESCSSGDIKPLGKCKGRLLNIFHKFSTQFLESTLDDFDVNAYPNLKLNLLQALMFYLTNLMGSGRLKDGHKTNCLKFLTLINDELKDPRFIRAILGSSVLLDRFDLFDSDGFSSKLVLQVLQFSEQSTAEAFLDDIRGKIVSTLWKMFKKPHKYHDSISVEVLKAVGLDHEHCVQVLQRFTASLDHKPNLVVVCYCLDRITEFAKSNLKLEPLQSEAVQELSRFLAVLIDNQTSGLNRLSLSLRNYLGVFPHCIEWVQDEVFAKLIAMSDFNRDNLALCEFLLDRRPEYLSCVKDNLDELCNKRSFLLSLIDVLVRNCDEESLRDVYTKFENHITKALQKPHKVGQHFQEHYTSVGILIEKFMSGASFGRQVLKFETSELWHVYLLKKVFEKAEKNDKSVANMTMTFVHLLVALLKQKSNDKKADNVAEIAQILRDFLLEASEYDLHNLATNEAFRAFCKLCLKHGIGGDSVLLDILTHLVEKCLSEEDATLVLEMMLSHSQFLDVMLGGSNKSELTGLWLTLCTKWPQFMERNHIPIVLSAYRGIREDRTLLSLLKLYERDPNRTKFFDFKPFLWGRGAASHYSIRSELNNVLWRQPKLVDVLNNLHFNTIQATITDPTDAKSYDLDFFLPLFSHMLAPENPVPTYIFTKSGALGLALAGFQGGHKTRILATSHILQRFYFHMEGRQSSKDSVLWLRFIEAICKAVVLLDDFKINNFVGVFLGRAALLLAQPTDVMYAPLTRYLAAKEAHSFEMIPELYTFLHSPHVDTNHHKHFILELMKDGLRSNKDFTVLWQSMAIKLMSELCSSKVSDFPTKMSVVNVFEACCKLDLGRKVLCGNSSFLTQIFGLVMNNLRHGSLLSKLLDILLKIVQENGSRQNDFIVYLNLVTLSEDKDSFQCLANCKNLGVYYRILSIVVDRFPDFMSEEQMMNFLDKSEDEFCRYLLRFGCSFVKESDCLSDSPQSFLRLVFYNKLKLK